MSLDKRIVVRITPDDEAWIAEQAADEGVHNATFVRRLINRLRRGRPPLMRLALAPMMAAAGLHDADLRPGRLSHGGALIEHDIEQQPAGAEEILAARLEELDPETAQQPDDSEAANGAPAAIPLHPVPRTAYNPGRS